MNLQVRFTDTRTLIHYLEEEKVIQVQKVLSDTKVLTECGKIISIRGEVRNAN